MRPPESVAVSVMRCVPTESPDVEKGLPVPSTPSRLELQRNAEPERVPSSGSVAAPVKETCVPAGTLVFAAGIEIVAVGAWFAGSTSTRSVAVPVLPPESRATSVMV